jgi:transposase
MKYCTFIGLDVHSRSIVGAAFDPMTGEIQKKSFPYDCAQVASWISSYNKPKAVYEAGCTGFHLARSLRDFGIECDVCAPSKLQRPSADARKKNDLNDAEFLARALSMNNYSPVFVPSELIESARDLWRAQDDARKALVVSRLHLTSFLTRHGYTFAETNEAGSPIGSWTRKHWEWIRNIQFDQIATQETLDYYISEVRHMESHKLTIEKRINRYAQLPEFKPQIDALRCLKGIETLSAFCLVAETAVFSRFSCASEFMAYVGLDSSEHSSGQHISRGSITKTGNTYMRRILIEAAWHYSRASKARKKTNFPDVPASIENHAARATARLVERRRYLLGRGKKPVVANVATARELAGFVWAIGRMAEGSL